SHKLAEELTHTVTEHTFFHRFEKLRVHWCFFVHGGQVDFDGQMKGRPDRYHFQLHDDLTQLFNAAGSTDAAVSNKADGFVVPLGENRVQGVFQNRRVSVVIFGGDDYERVAVADLGGPFSDRFVRIVAVES